MSIRISANTPILCTFLLCTLNLTTVTSADEAAALAGVTEQGGTVRVIAKDSTDKEATFHLSDKEVGDEALVHLKDIPNLVWLNLRGTKISDEGLKNLSDLKSLTRLHLEKTAITDGGLAHLANLENLEYLNLYGTKVTDAGLDHLKNLKKLKKLYVWQTEVSKEGAEQLSAAIPEIYINRGADAEPGPPTKTLANARYIKVSLEGDKRILSLAEVQLIETATGKELQGDGTASQSSNYQDTTADRAKDGNVESAFDKGSVTHTNEESNPWWLIDLGDTKDIGKVVIHNRAEVGDRLKDAKVEAFDASLSVVWTDKVSDAKDGSVSEFTAK
ncbi:MAG: hypothetical protein GY768_01130 [Planctomycetaceae bacterium]|nr:hypothetical protein [Planctomycetaceae bacterium]